MSGLQLTPPARMSSLEFSRVWRGWARHFRASWRQSPPATTPRSSTVETGLPEPLHLVKQLARESLRRGCGGGRRIIRVDRID